MNVKSTSGVYELAYSRYRDERYLVALAPANRTGDFALWFGVGELPERAPEAMPSTDYPSSGYAVFRNGEGENGTWLRLKYGPHGGGHGHYDRLSFVLCRDAQVISPDPGTCAYGLSQKEGWYVRSLAHNTLVIDQEPQARSQGRCLGVGSTDGCDWAITSAGPIYDDVLFTRGITVMKDQTVVIVDFVRCKAEHTLDMTYHQSGVWGDLPEGTSWGVPDVTDYQYLQDCTIRPATAPFSLTTLLPDGSHSSIGIMNPAGAEIITATGVGTSLNDRVPIVIVRKTAREAAWVWVLPAGDTVPDTKIITLMDGCGEPLHESEGLGVRIGDRVLMFNPTGREVGPEIQGHADLTDAIFDVIRV
jgi:oligo-alginate lyase